MKKYYYILVSIILTISFFLHACRINDENTKETTNKITDTTYAELISLFDEYSATLDGAYAEKYAYDLYDAYKRTGCQQFINLLSSYDAFIVDHIIKLLIGEAVNNDGNDAIEEFTTVFKKLHDDKNLSEMKKYIVYDIYTWILYYKITLK